ncbi:low-density lipoprotein receptor-related protein 1B-like [Bradysia coprophila]|uniref:low-density lipoprotein receptor-related protein 1B-like n=1 Tax=Bradysia coprophila TaxID=38358 RepID=UPI00187DBBB4|nr:low-density lipoprotein receptor-related protein 1B-like [Bradysia coprophila]
MKIESNFLYVVLSVCAFSSGITLATRRSYGEECNRINKCDKAAWLSCRDGKCDCSKPDEMLYDEGKGKCVTKSGERCKYGALSEETLVEITDCVKNSICSADGVCECDSKYHETYNGTCRLSVLFGENCSEEDQCSKFVGLQCVDGKCECKDGIYSRERGLCVGRSQGSCLRNECVDGAICVQDKCLCDSDHFHSIDKTCLPRKKILDNCTRDVECLQTDTLNLRCISGICNCQDKFEYLSVQKYEYRDYSRFPTDNGFKPFAIGFTGPVVEMCAPRLGEKCPEGYCMNNAFCDAEVQYSDSYTEPIYDSCRCINQQYSPNKNFEYCAGTYDQDCTDDSDCIDDLVCSAGKCNCPSPWHQFFDYSTNTCVTKVGGHCTSSSTCVPNSNCVHASTTNKSGHCRCNPNFVANIDRNCDLAYGADCTEENVKCDSFAGLLCINNKCSCPDAMYEYNARFRQCLGLVGATCTKSQEGDGHDCVDNAYCKETQPLFECDCVDGYVEADDHTCMSIAAMESQRGQNGDIDRSDRSNDKNVTKAPEITYDNSTCNLHICNNGQCIRNEWVCDGIVQCDDNSDEMNCPEMNTGYGSVNMEACHPLDQFTCASGECIESSRFCDGNIDCDDDSDEPDYC